MKNIVISRFHNLLIRKDMTIIMFNNRAKTYSMKEASKLINIPIGTIKQWENELSGLLVIPRTKQGARFCTEKELVLLQQIKETKEQFLHKNEVRKLLEEQLMATNSQEKVNAFSQLEVQIPEMIETSHQQAHSGEECEAKERQDPAVTTMEPIEVYPIQEQTMIAAEIEVIQPDERYKQNIELFKQELLTDIKKEIQAHQKDLLDELKKELLTQSLQTVQEVSKSIQRSNDKHQGNVQFLTDTIHQVSQKNSEQFTSLTQTLKHASQGTTEQYLSLINELEKSSQVIEQLETLPKNLLKVSEEKWDKVTKQITQSTLTSSHHNRQSIEKMSDSVEDVREQLENIVQVIAKEQRQMNEAMNEIKVSTAKIYQREEQFQQMVSGLREVAAAKSKRSNWWKFWE
jgi:DNA-binding transcriptional MerR regulator